jgi:hypothetical protein
MTWDDNPLITGVRMASNSFEKSIKNTIYKITNKTTMARYNTSYKLMEEREKAGFCVNKDDLVSPTLPLELGVFGRLAWPARRLDAT